MALDELFLPAVEIRDATCEICPAQLLRFGAFDVSERPGRNTRWDDAAGCRVGVTTGTPTCVHPFRVGLPAGAYASEGASLPPPAAPPAPDPSALELPEDVTLLEGWFVALLRTADLDAMASTLFRAEAIASQRFASRDVVTAMRRVMSRELV